MIQIPKEIFEMLLIIKRRFLIIIVLGFSFSYYSYQSQSSIQPISKNIISLGSFYQKNYQDNWEYKYSLLKNKVICSDIVDDYLISKDSHLIIISSSNSNLNKFTNCILDELNGFENVQFKNMNVILNKLIVAEKLDHSFNILPRVIETKLFLTNYKDTKIIEFSKPQKHESTLSITKLLYNFIYGIVVGIFLIYALQVLAKKN